MKTILPIIIGELLSLGSKGLEKRVSDLTVGDICELLVRINARTQNVIP